MTTEAKAYWNYVVFGLTALTTLSFGMLIVMYFVSGFAMDFSFPAQPFFLYQSLATLVAGGLSAAISKKADWQKVRGGFICGLCMSVVGGTIFTIAYLTAHHIIH
jgi:hypothetical protein